MSVWDSDAWLRPPVLAEFTDDTVGKRRDAFLAMMGWLWGGNVMIKAPLLSICIPAYNRPVWLWRGLESVAVGNAVGASRVEVVITDDSDDDTVGAIAGDILKGWHYRYEHHERPLGMAQNWNRAIALARGNYVMVLHDDDFFVPGGLGRLLESLQDLKGRYPVLLFGAEVVDAQERVMKRQVFGQDQCLSPHDALIRLFSNSSFVRFPAHRVADLCEIAMERRVFEEVGYFNPDWQEPCDLEMWMRLFAKYGVYCCQGVTVAYRVHSEALTMGSFHEKTVGILLALFGELSGLGILTEQEIERCQALFLHQYILAGAWRQLRRGRWQGFQRVMGLFELPELKSLSCPVKWWFLKGVFFVLGKI